MNCKKIVIITIGVLVFLLATLCVVYEMVFKVVKPDEPPVTTTTSYNNYEEVDAEYDIIKTKEDYTDKMAKKYGSKSNTFKYEDNFNEKDLNNYNYIIISIRLMGCSEYVKDYNIVEDSDTLRVYYDINRSCGLCAPFNHVIIKKINKNIRYVNTYYKNVNNPRCDSNVDYKPLIYIYPTKDMDLTVKLGNKDVLTHTYPKYKDSWNVHVSKDGNIYDYDTKRNYYGLYWEAIDNYKLNMKEGFVVKGEDTIKLLEDKLKVLGLNDHEINEFIIYWIDKVENNKYNYIYFRTTDEVNKLMPLEFSKNPDTLIRVIVDFVPLDENIEVKEQKLIPQTRKGYSVIEWGGNIHKNI